MVMRPGSLPLKSDLLPVFTPTASPGPFFVRLELPPRELSPNARIHWRVKAKTVKAYRYACEVDGRNARIRQQLQQPLPPPVWAHLVFVFLTGRRRDEDNLHGALKAGWDGLVDAGVLQDDSQTKLHIATIEVYSVKALDGRYPTGVYMALVSGGAHAPQELPGGDFPHRSPDDEGHPARRRDVAPRLGQPKGDRPVGRARGR